MSTDLLVIVDDGRIHLGGILEPRTIWTLSESRRWYKSTCSISGQAGSITVTFNGTSAAVVGSTPPSSSPQTATVQIDSGTPFSIDYDDSTPPTYKQWFATPTLPDGSHTMTISNLYEAAIDYIVVKVGNDTSLTGQTVIVDDDSSLIQYSGQWTRNTNTFTSGRSSLGLSATPGYPYGNATHWSSKPGDNFTFRFSGTSIAIYGIISWNDPGSLAATYSIDGTPHLSFISVDPSATGYTNDGEVTNQLYFYLDRLSSGPHTLFVNITEANHQIFKLDYIVYTPSFDTLASMPSLSAGISSTTGSGTSSSSTASASHHSVSTGAFVGGVFGGLAIGVLLTLLLILYRRRAQQQGRVHQGHDAALGGGLNDANILNPSGPNYFQMQEYQSPFTHRRPFRPSPHHERSSSVTGPDSNTTPTYLATGGNSTSVDEPWADTPPHDTISNRL